MDAWQRFVRTVEFEPTDHVPVALLGTNRFYASLAGVPLFEVLHDPYRMMEVQQNAFRRFPEITFIPGVWPDYGAGILSAFGCGIYWPAEGMPQVKVHAIHCDGDIEEFRVPDPHSDGFMPWYLQTLRMFAKRRGDFEANMHFLWSLGPGELASYLWGASEFLVNLYAKPDLVVLLLEKITESILTWLRAQQEIIPDAEGILLTDDIAGMMSDTLYRRFLQRCHQRVREEFPEHVLVFHNDTLSDHLFESLCEVGIDVFNLGKTTNLRRAKEVMDHRVALMGNVDPLDLLPNGTASEVIEASRFCLAQTARGGGFMLSAGGGLNEGTPPENLDALLSAVRELGTTGA